MTYAFLSKLMVQKPYQRSPPRYYLKYYSDQDEDPKDLIEFPLLHIPSTCFNIFGEFLSNISISTLFRELYFWCGRIPSVETHLKFITRMLILTIPTICSIIPIYYQKLPSLLTIGRFIYPVVILPYRVYDSSISRRARRHIIHFYNEIPLIHDLMPEFYPILPLPIIRGSMVDY